MQFSNLSLDSQAYLHAIVVDGFKGIRIYMNIGMHEEPKMFTLGNGTQLYSHAWATHMHPTVYL